MIKLSWRTAVHWAGALWLFLAGVLFVGCETAGGPSFSGVPSGVAATGAPENSTDIFHVGDLVMVVFSGSDPIPPHEERIKDDGTITLSLIGAVKADGKTPGVLQKEIQDMYVPRYYKNLIVTIKSQLRYYSVGGEVRSPGLKEYVGETDIIKAIQSAGDFTDFANKTRVKLVRANGRSETINVKRAIQNPEKYKVVVYPGDSIIVPRHW